MLLSDFDHRFYECVRNDIFETLGNFVSEPDAPYLSFAENEIYLRRACNKDSIRCIICPPELASHPVLLASGKGIAVSSSPRCAFNQFHNWLVEHYPPYTGSYAATVIGPDCSIAKTAHIAPVGVSIGSHVVIHENAVISSGATIGDYVTINAGAVIGDSSLVSVKGADGNRFIVKQVGGVHLCEHAYIGAYALIARGSFPYDCTEIGPYTACDSQSIISHNSKLGSNCIITAQSQICGNCVIGNNVRINPRSVISNRIHIADGAAVDIGSVVVTNLKENDHVGGNFAVSHEKFLLWHRKKLHIK